MKMPHPMSTFLKMDPTQQQGFKQLETISHNNIDTNTPTVPRMEMKKPTDVIPRVLIHNLTFKGTKLLTQTTWISRYLYCCIS